MSFSVDEVYEAICDSNAIDSSDSLIYTAFKLAEKAHKGKTKSSGEPFVLHCIRTMGILSAWGLSKQTLAAGLLHDVMDIPNTNNPVLFKVLHDTFGPEIAKTVKELNRLNSIQQADEVGSTYENFLSLLDTSSNLQALLIKLASGLELARTIDLMQDINKKRDRARFLLSVYSPTAAKLGMWEYKSELEDQCFRAWFSQEYESLLVWRERALKEKENLIRSLTKDITNRHKETTVRVVKRNLYSLFESLQKRSISNIDEDRLRNLLQQGQAFRLIVVSSTRGECYNILGTLHEIGTPSPGGFKDFIGAPHANGYSSIDTLINYQGVRVDARIRTSDRDLIAEKGVLSPLVLSAWEKQKPENASNLADNQHPYSNDEINQCVEILMKSLLKRTPSPENRILVHTPQAKHYVLPLGSTALDFAYAVHSDFGDQFGVATVGDESVSMNYVLHDGDTVQVFTDPDSSPTIEWLDYVRTPRAKKALKRFLNLEPKERGRINLVRALAKRGWNWDDHDIQSRINRLAKPIYGDLSQMFMVIGKSEIAADQIVTQFADQLDVDYWYSRIVIASELEKAFKNRRLYIHLPRCCGPKFPDKIIGSIHGRNLTIHKYGCDSGMKSRNRVPVEWKATKPIEVTINIQAMDRLGLAMDVTRVISNQAYNISDLHATADRSGYASVVVSLKLPNHIVLGHLLRDLEAIEDIVSAQVFENGRPLSRDLFQEHPSLTPGFGHEHRPMPYSPGRPISDRNMFFGRKREIRKILDYILPIEDPTSLILCSQRRVGKTSLALRIINDQRARREYIPVFMDLSYYVRTREDVILRAIKDRIFEEVRKFGFDSGVSRKFSSDPFTQFDREVDDLNVQFLSKNKRKRILLVLDEFDAILRNMQLGLRTERFFNAMRSWCQHQPITLIIVGSRKIQDTLQSFLPGFLNVFVSDKLGPLDLYDARSLITKPVMGAIYYDTEVQEKILAVTGNYPYYIHLTCAKLFSQVTANSRTNVTTEDLSEVLRELSGNQSVGYYLHLWNDENNYEGLAIAYLASLARDESSNWVSLDSILSLHPEQAEYIDLQDALESMYKIDTIEKAISDNQPMYRIQIPLFQMWIRQNKITRVSPKESNL